MGLFGHDTILLGEHNMELMVESTINYFENFNILEESLDIDIVNESKVGDAFKVVVKKIKEALKKIGEKIVEIFNNIKKFISSKFNKKVEKEAEETEKEINNSPLKNVKVDKMPSDEEINKVAEEISKKTKEGFNKIHPDMPIKDKEEKEPYKNDENLEKEVKNNKDQLGIHHEALKKKLENIINLKKYRYMLVNFFTAETSIYNTGIGKAISTGINNIFDNYLNASGKIDEDDWKNRTDTTNARQDIANLAANYKNDRFGVDHLYPINRRHIDNYHNPDLDKVKENINKMCDEETSKKFANLTVSSMLKELKENSKYNSKYIGQVSKGEEDMKRVVSKIDKVLDKIASEASLHSKIDDHQFLVLTKKYNDVRNKYGENNQSTKDAKKELEKYQNTHFDFRDNNFGYNDFSPQDIVKIFSGEIKYMKICTQMYGILFYLYTTQAKQIQSGIKAIKSLVN